MMSIWKHYIHSAGCRWTILESDSCSQLKQVYASLNFCGLYFTIQLFSSKVENSLSISVTKMSLLFMLHVDRSSISSHHMTEQIFRKIALVLQEKWNSSPQTYPQRVVLCLVYQLRINCFNFALNSFQTRLLRSSGCHITQVLLFYKVLAHRCWAHWIVLMLINTRQLWHSGHSTITVSSSLVFSAGQLPMGAWMVLFSLTQK